MHDICNEIKEYFKAIFHFRLKKKITKKKPPKNPTLMPTGIKNVLHYQNAETCVKKMKRIKLLMIVAFHNKVSR